MNYAWMSNLGKIMAPGAAAGGDVEFVQVQASAWDTANPTTGTGQAITWGSGTNTVGFACVITSGTGSISGVAGSVTGAWTAVPNSDQTNTEDRTKGVAWYYKINPTPGAETVTASFSGTINAAQVTVIEYTNVNQTTPYGTPVRANIASGSTTYDHVVTDGVVGDYFLSGMINGDPANVTLMDVTSSGDDPLWEVAENSYWNTGSIGATRAADDTSHTFSYLIEDAGSAISGFAVKKA
jgi:hypothetical protein